MATATALDRMNKVVTLARGYQEAIDATAAVAHDLRKQEQGYRDQATAAGEEAARKEAELAEVAGKTLADLLKRLGVNEANDVARIIGQAKRATAKPPAKKKATPAKQSVKTEEVDALAAPKAPTPPLAIDWSRPQPPEAMGTTAAALRAAFTDEATLEAGRVNGTFAVDGGGVYACLEFDPNPDRVTFTLYRLGDREPIDGIVPVGLAVKMPDGRELYVQDDRREVVVKRETGQGGK